jgi:CPA1 family monovalent cation:H+ antiporter
MLAFELALVLLAVAAVLAVLSERIGIPTPVVLVLGGIVLAVVPGVPRPELNPELIFLLFVPPLLYGAAVQSSLRDFRRHARSISLLSVFMVIVTTVAVAVVARAITPELTWPAAFALGAIVSPPDAVAVTAVARRIGIPRSIITVLEGESLFNDATALVAYRMAVAAALTGTFSLASAGAEFAIDAVGGVAVGVVVGLAYAPIVRLVSGMPEVASTLSLLVPFVAYIPADHLGFSGVLSVVATGLLVQRRSSSAAGAAARVLVRSMWSVVGFLLEGGIFLLIGLELPRVLGALGDHPPGELALLAIAVSATVIGVRLLLVPPSALAVRALSKEPAPPWGEMVFLGWAGLRGGDSLVIALSLPVVAAGGMPFPGRDLILFVTFAVILVTLVLQGMTLKPAVRLLRLSPDRSDEEEEAEARRRLVAVGLARRKELAGADDAHVVRLQVIEAQRRELVRLRDSDVIGDRILRLLQRDLDLEEMLLESSSGLESVVHLPD